MGKLSDRFMRNAAFDLSDHGITGSIEGLVNSIIAYYESKEHINIVGIGERLHYTRILEDVFVPYLLPALAKSGYKQLLIEAVLRNAEPELKVAYKLLDGYRKYSRSERVNLLKTWITTGPSFPILKYNYEALLGGSYGTDILLLIVTAHDLGVELHGMIYSNQVMSDSFEMARRFADGGREQALRLKKNGKLLIYGGDMHVCCNILHFVLLDKGYKEPATLSFGPELLNDPEVNYINLTILCGTAESIRNANSGNTKLFQLSGYKFYLKMFKNLNPGMARYIHTEEEGSRRGILLYNNSTEAVRRTVKNPQ